MKKNTPKQCTFAFAALFLLTFLIACSDGELLDPNSADISEEVTGATDKPRADKFDSNWVEIDPSEIISDVSDLLSEESNSSATLVSSEAISSQIAISSFVLGFSSDGTQSSAVVSSIQSVSSVDVSSSYAISSSLALSSSTPISSSAVPIGS